MSTIREWLEADHRAMGALLDRADAGGRLDVDAFEALRARLLRHIGIEEKVLLAAARDRRGAPLARARQIRVEHGAIASLLVPTPDLALVG
ncbi:MAG: hemerythrin domain-containing protein, partial [Myxococcota bacterium]|nr:hemerythrin domain-containing protein [Myxococcota bacterium]